MPPLSWYVRLNVAAPKRCAAHFLLCAALPNGVASAQQTRGNARCTTTSSWAAARPARCIANRLSARSANKVLVCEAGQDTPPGEEPPGDRRQLLRHRLFRPALPLDRAQGPHPGRLPQQSAREPPAAAQVRAGARAGRRLVDQRPDGQSRRADRLRRMGGARRRGLGLGQRPALFQEGRARSRLRRTTGTARTAASRCAASRPSTGPSTPRRSAKAFASQAGMQVPARPERRVRRRLLPGHRIPTPRSGASRRRWAISTPRRASGANLTISTDTQVKSLLFEGTRCVGVTAMVDGKEQEFRGERGDPVLRRHPFAGASAARRHRPGRPSAATWASRCVSALRRRRPAADGPSVDLAVVLHPPRRAHERAHAPAHPARPALFLGPARHPEGRHVRRGGQQVGLACGRRADRLAAHLHQQDLLGDRPGQARLDATGAPSRSSSSTCCPTSATSTG